MSQMMRHVPVDPLNPAHHSGRRIDALETDTFEVEYRGEDRLHGNEVSLQYLRDAVVRVDESLELIVRPARWYVIQCNEGSVGFDWAVVGLLRGNFERVPIGLLKR